MKKIIYFIFALILFLFLSFEVSAAQMGELVYGIENVSITDKKINISGYAFIHGVNNYVKVYKRYNRDTNNVSSTELIADNGGQKVKILVTSCDVDSNGNLDTSCINNNNSIIKEYYCLDDEESGQTKYNFYYQHFVHNVNLPYGRYGVDVYNNYDYSCYRGSTANQCYYEDMFFKVSFSIDELVSKFSSSDELKFYIAASNNSYIESDYRYSQYSEYTAYSTVKITSVTGKSDYIEITQGQANGKIVVVANKARVQQIYGNGQVNKYNSSLVFPDDNTVFYLDPNKGNKGYVYIRNDGRGGSFLNGTHGPGLYAMCVSTGGTIATDACNVKDSNNYCISCGGKVLYAYGSWITLTDESRLKINVKNPNKCDVTDPDENEGNLVCNGNKTFKSTCEELSIITTEGIVDVKIEQTGNISSVLTPDNVYAGGGFSFGIMYYNTIKWSYVSGQNISDSLHKKVVDVMNDKIKDYDSYVANININNLKLGGKTFNMVKKCTTSNVNKDYYNKELTVSCVFTFPKSDIDQQGNVNYNYDVSGLNINNKYYTPIDYSGNYKIEANIVGMDRITENSSKEDSKDGKSWTGQWSDTFYDCNINLYSLLMNTSGENNNKYTYNFIYRPIDLYNPFPGRNAGINWFDWYSLIRNKERLEDTYSNLQYTVKLDNNAIADIKSYNDSHNYLEWDSINENTGLSSFITEKNYIDRVGDY